MYMHHTSIDTYISFVYTVSRLVNMYANLQ